MTHGVAVGDVTPHSAVLWARGDREGILSVRLSGGRHDRVERLQVRAGDDYAGKLLLEGLRPDVAYRYRVGHTHGGTVARGTFRTAPARTTPLRCGSPWAVTSADRTSAVTRGRGSRS